MNKNEIRLQLHSKGEMEYVKKVVVKAITEYRQKECKCTWKDLIRFGWSERAIKGHHENCPLYWEGFAKKYV